VAIPRLKCSVFRDMASRTIKRAENPKGVSHRLRACASHRRFWPRPGRCGSTSSSSSPNWRRKYPKHEETHIAPGRREAPAERDKLYADRTREGGARRWDTGLRVPAGDTMNARPARVRRDSAVRTGNWISEAGAKVARVEGCLFSAFMIVLEGEIMERRDFLVGSAMDLHDGRKRQSQTWPLVELGGR